jgi:serine/threonine protein kinase
MLSTLPLAVPPPPRPVANAETIEILGVLGSGSFGVVSLARVRGKLYALKQISHIPSKTADEIACWNGLKHQNIVRFIKHRLDSTMLSIFMEYVDGRSLADHFKLSGPVAEAVLGRIACLCLQALRYLREKHVLHRDVKPSNILLSRTGQVKVCDFGLGALLASSSDARGTGTGTIKYMSPERLESKPYNWPADIWSLGLVLYEGAAGRYPVEDAAINVHDLPRRLAVSLDFRLDGYSPQFIDFLRACLTILPEKRMLVEDWENSWAARFRVSGQSELQAWIDGHVFPHQ